MSCGDADRAIEFPRRVIGPPGNSLFIAQNRTMTTCLSAIYSNLEVNMKEQPIEAPSDLATEVRDFYERMPYPAPLTDLEKERELYKNPDRRRVLFHRIWPTEPLRRNQEILIAGCGTSQAARYALREPDSRVT